MDQMTSMQQHHSNKSYTTICKKDSANEKVNKKGKNILLI